MSSKGGTEGPTPHQSSATKRMIEVHNLIFEPAAILAGSVDEKQRNIFVKSIGLSIVHEIIVKSMHPEHLYFISKHIVIRINMYIVCFNTYA